jgi:hypothetical protein
MNFKDQILRKLRLQGQKSNFTRLLNIELFYFLFFIYLFWSLLFQFGF